MQMLGPPLSGTRVVEARIGLPRGAGRGGQLVEREGLSHCEWTRPPSCLCCNYRGRHFAAGNATAATAVASAPSLNSGIPIAPLSSSFDLGRAASLTRPGGRTAAPHSVINTSAKRSPDVDQRQRGVVERSRTQFASSHNLFFSATTLSVSGASAG